MLMQLSSSLGFFAGFMVLALFSSRSALRGQLAQEEVLQRGRSASGRIVSIWQPPLPGSYTRLYFEFEPEGADAVVRCCHVDRRPTFGPAASLPSVGSAVSVRYLAENPHQAVIARLVSRMRL